MIPEYFGITDKNTQAMLETKAEEILKPILKRFKYSRVDRGQLFKEMIEQLMTVPLTKQEVAYIFFFSGGIFEWQVLRPDEEVQFMRKLIGGAL